MIPAVEDFTQKLQASDTPLSMAGRRLLQPQELRAQLEGLANKRYAGRVCAQHHVNVLVFAQLVVLLTLLCSTFGII